LANAILPGDARHICALRHGFWVSGGPGYGSLGCQDCSGRTGSVSGNIALGGTLSQKVLPGVSTNGLGYDIPVGRTVSLTPYWNGFALSYSGGDAKVGQLGLGITVH